MFLLSMVANYVSLYITLLVFSSYSHLEAVKMAVMDQQTVCIRPFFYCY